MSPTAQGSPTEEQQ
jgi:hypothetical protein